MATTETIPISLAEGRAVEGDLVCPDGATGLVVFAHGSGSGRRSYRNRWVAEMLHEHGLATLLIDLLTRDEEIEESATGHLRFDIDLLATRLLAARHAAAQRADVGSLPVGYFGASTGGAAALVAAAAEPDVIRAVVSRGGRPDLAGGALARVRAPTLLIVGSRDDVVLRLNRQAAAELTCAHRLEVVAGATHLFEEPGTLEQVAQLAAGWFTHHLA